MTELNKRYIFTGGPGFGKSAVLSRLEAAGFTVVPEAPRQLLLEEGSKPDGILPQNDFPGFALMVGMRMIEQYRNADNGLVLFDRGIPDIPAYLRNSGYLVPPVLSTAATEYRYEPTVFFFPDWEDIYELDGVRYESFHQAREIGEALKESYRNLGYELTEVPRMDVERRVEFVRERLPSLF